MTAMLPPKSLLNNRYRVVAHVGQGGMGSVYKALGVLGSCLLQRGDKYGILLMSKALL